MNCWARCRPRLRFTWTRRSCRWSVCWRRVAGWRAAGQRIVFTNGCFDLLHIGHITLLEQARQKGDRLIVGLNSDSSVRRVKGPPRPLVGEQERAKILAALSAVDAVVLFDESTPLKLIEAIRPGRSGEGR